MVQIRKQVLCELDLISWSVQCWHKCVFFFLTGFPGSDKKWHNVLWENARLGVKKSMRHLFRVWNKKNIVGMNIQNMLSFSERTTALLFLSNSGDSVSAVDGIGPMDLITDKTCCKWTCQNRMYRAMWMKAGGTVYKFIWCTTGSGTKPFRTRAIYQHKPLSHIINNAMVGSRKEMKRQWRSSFKKGIRGLSLVLPVEAWHV